MANSQIAGAGDLISLLAGDEKSSFASLLGLGESGDSAAHRDDGSRGKQSSRPKEKETHDGPSPALQDARSSSTSNSPHLQTLSNVAIAPWQLEPGDHSADKDMGDVSLSPSLVRATKDVLQARDRTFVADIRAADAPASNSLQSLSENVAQMPFHDLNDPKLVEPSKDGNARNQGTTAIEPVAQPNGNDPKPVAARSSSLTPGAVQSSSGLVGSGVQTLIRQGDVNPKLVGISVAQSYTPSDHEAKSHNEGRNPAISAGELRSDLSSKDAGGQTDSSAPSQGVVVGAVSRSTTGGHSQGNAGDPHRGSSDAKEALAVSHVPAPQTSQISNLAALGSGGPAHGHSVLVKSTGFESVREPASNAQLKDLTSSRVTEASTARLLGSAVRADLRVGVQTEAFGRVTIQTNTQGGQLSAQLSLENAKESATLAAHLPGVEQKIVQQHGLNATVRLTGGFDGGTGTGSMGRDQSGSSRREPERYHSDVAMRPEGIGHETRSDGRGVETALLGRRYLLPSRLDVTV